MRLKYNSAVGDLVQAALPLRAGKSISGSNRTADLLNVRASDRVGYKILVQKSCKHRTGELQLNAKARKVRWQWLSRDGAPS